MDICLFFQTLPAPDTVTQFAKGYEDYLQCPLQPLMDNLESQTYEIFEKDPIKYSQYQKVRIFYEIYLFPKMLFLCLWI